MTCPSTCPGGHVDVHLGAGTTPCARLTPGGAAEPWRLPGRDPLAVVPRVGDCHLPNSDRRNVPASSTAELTVRAIWDGRLASRFQLKSRAARPNPQTEGH